MSELSVIAEISTTGSLRTYRTLWRPEVHGWGPPWACAVSSEGTHRRVREQKILES
jgi:hypothetical protein